MIGYNLSSDDRGGLRHLDQLYYVPGSETPDNPRPRGRIS